MTTKSTNAEQPPPTPNAGTPVWDIVIADMAERDRIGRERYKTPLQTHNGHDHLVDAYQEALDKIVYLRAEIEERFERERPRVPGEAWLDEQGELWTYVGTGEAGAAGVGYSFERDRGELVEHHFAVASRIPSWKKTVPPIPHRAAMAEEIQRLQARVQELLESNTALVNELRRVDRKRMVREFHAKFGQPIGERPAVPDEATVRFRARLMVEEAFKEMLLAMFEPSREEPWRLQRAIEEAFWVVDHCPVRVDLADVIDMTIDADYVIEGLRVTFGVDATPLWEAVHDKNLQKVGGTKRADGKILKPAGWTPCDIGELLRKQGWAG